jgi:WD40 repeat protein
MCLWDLRTAKEMKRFPGPAGTDFAGCHALSPDFRTVALSTARGAVLCELATGQVRGRFSGHNAFIIGLHFSPDGRLLISASGDETALV